MKKTLVFFLLLICCISYAADYDDLLLANLHSDAWATYGDGIAIVRLLYNEPDHNAMYLDNILWAAGKKLFKVSLPIKNNKLDPELTRAEFAYWLCGLYNLAYEDDALRPQRYWSYKTCVELGIMEPGAGPYDRLTKAQLLDIFSVAEYYVRANNIGINNNLYNGLLVPDSDNTDDRYRDYPKWRRIIYRELDDQRADEAKRRKQAKQKRLEKNRERVLE